VSHLGLVVVERHPQVIQEPQHLDPMAIQPGEQVGRGRAAQATASASNSAIPAAQPCPGSSVTASSSRSRCAPHSACVTW
jgi:hypothetical protein